MEENSNKLAASVCPPQLDSRKYRVFERRRKPGQRHQHVAASIQTLPNRDASPELAAWRSAVNTPAWGTQSVPSVPPPVPASVWQGVAAPAWIGPRPLCDLHKPPILASVAVTSCAGGCGASTVSASLAAGFALSGHAVMFDEYTNNHTFSYYFGVDAVEQNLVRSFATPAGGLLHLVFNAPGSNDQSAAVITALQHQLNWVVTDCELGQIPSDVEIVLAVCAPEPRSLMSAVTLKRWLDRQRPQQQFFFVMNQYDEASSLHRRMRDRLAEQVGPMLLSVTIPKTDEICEAFLKGKTVLEFAPDALVCGEFRRLAAWLGALCEKQGVQQ